MPTAIKVVPALTALKRNFQHVILLGTQRDLTAFAATEAFRSSTVGSTPFASMVTSAIASTKAGSYAGSSTSVTIPSQGAAQGSDQPAYVRVSVCALPSAATRFNCALRPDAATKLVKSALGQQVAEVQAGDGKAKVLLVCAAPSLGAASKNLGSAVALGCAAARACPVYSRKGNDRSTPSKTDLEVSFMFAEEPSGNVSALAEADETKVQIAIDGVRNAARLVDMPCNELNTFELEKAARDMCKDLPGVKVESIVGEELRRRGLGGIYGVGQAALVPPRLIILTYEPEDGDVEATYAWCGKGIVYDTGGLSIKGKTAMPGMKRDMGGAAGVLCAFVAAAKTKPKCRLHCLLAAAENAVGPRATKPDDIHVMYSGKTVEINNTDAEGRLVLADAVAYAADKYSPDIIVNMCTLTGAQGISTGSLHASILCSDEDLEQATVAAGRTTGDLVHPMPWCPELFSNEFASAVADMKNSVKNRSNAQVSCAGQFIGNHLPADFLESGHKWLHIDMAGPAYSGERATGYGVALLLQAFVFTDSPPAAAVTTTTTI